MGQAETFLLLVAGILMVVSGLRLVLRSVRRLQRTGVFGSLFWASFGRFAGYRLRSLRPVAGVLLGIAIVAAGLSALYIGVVGFYAGRLGGLSG